MKKPHLYSQSCMFFILEVIPNILLDYTSIPTEDETDDLKLVVNCNLNDGSALNIIVKK